MADRTLKVRLQNARDVKQNWERNDPVLLDGEIAVVYDTTDDPNQAVFKIGNGTSKYSELDFFEDVDKVRKSEVGKPNGVAALDENGKVLLSQLPKGLGSIGEPGVIEKIPEQLGILVYTGESMMPVWKYYGPDAFIIGGTIIGTDAGDYLVSFQPAPDYTWEDGTTEPVYCTWTIQKAPVDKPSASSVSYVYNGTERNAPISGFDASTMVLSGDIKATGVGNYTTFCAPDDNHVWSDGTTDPVEIVWSITPKLLDYPAFEGADSTQSGNVSVYNYTGSTIAPTIANYSADTMLLTGTTSGVNAMTTSTAVTFVPKPNHCWTDGSMDAYTLYWQIVPSPTLIVPTVKNALTFTGATQEPEWNNYDPAKMTMTGTLTGVNAGSYNVVFTPTANYTWKDGRLKKDQEVTWAIGRANGSCSLSATTGTVDKGNTVQITATGHVSATFTASSSNTNVATVSVSGNKVTITGGSTAGSATITVTAGQTTNHNAASTTYTITNYLASLTVPTTNYRIYTGSSQSPDWSGLDTAKMTTGGTLTSTNAGTYSATVTPKSGYRWTDGTTGSKTVQWTIAKAPGNVALNSTSGTTDKAGTVQVTATAHSGATITAVSSNTNVATVSVSGSKVTITGGSTAGSATITVTASAGPNHNAASATYTLTNYLASLTVPTTTNRTYNGSSQSPNWSGLNTTTMSTGGTTSATNAGNYNATVTPKSGYRWTDGGTGAKTVVWTIDKANGYISRSDTQKIWANVEQGQTLTYTFNMHPGATLSATSAESTSVYTVSTYNNELRIVGGNTFGSNGYKITVTASATQNYNAASMTCAATNWVGSVPVPTIKGNRTYNGSSQTPYWDVMDASITTLSGTTSSTNAGTYTVKATPKSGYRWAGTVDNCGEKSYNWTINQAPGTLTIENTTTPGPLNLGVGWLKMGYYRKIQCNTTGTISVVSSDSTIAVPEIRTDGDNGLRVTTWIKKKGSTTVTVSVGADPNYTTPSPVSFTVNANIPSSTLSECTWAEIKSAVDESVATRLWQVGDLSPWVDLRGKFGVHNLNPYKCNFRVVNLTDSEIIFQLAQHSGRREIAFTDGQYGVCVPANTDGMCMNRMGMLRNTEDSSLTDSEKTYGSNKGGYNNTYAGRELMGELDGCFPDEVKNVWAMAFIYTDCVGQGSTDASAIKGLNCHVYLPSQVEIFGHTNGMNPNMANYAQQLQWYAAGNKVNVYGTYTDSTLCQWFLRDSSTVYPFTDFRIVNTDGTNRQESAARSEGMRPCFRIAKT